MVTKRKLEDGHTEVKRVVTEGADEPYVRVTVCCCAAAGETRQGCTIVAGHKALCRCDCHRGAEPRR